MDTDTTIRCFELTRERALVHLIAHYDPMATPLKMDVMTGDKITPSSIAYDYPLLFDDRSIHIMSYPVETVMAKKLETVLSRGIANTCPRDYYDIHMLLLMYLQSCLW